MSTVANPQVAAIAFNVDLLPDDNEGQQFAQRIYSMIEPYNALVERKRTSDILSHTNQHEALVLERRQLEAQKSEMLDEQRLLVDEGSEKDRIVRNLQMKLKTTQENFNFKWALPSEVAAHDTSVARTQEELNTAIAEKMASDQMLAAWQERFVQLLEEIQSLEGKVAKVWAAKLRVEGYKAYSVDRETGLPQ